MAGLYHLSSCWLDVARDVFIWSFFVVSISWVLTFNVAYKVEYFLHTNCVFIYILSHVLMNMINGFLFWFIGAWCSCYSYGKTIGGGWTYPFCLLFYYLCFFYFGSHLVLQNILSAVNCCEATLDGKLELNMNLCYFPIF